MTNEQALFILRSMCGAMYPANTDDQEALSMAISALSAHPPAPPEGWQPIETAPRNAKILLFGKIDPLPEQRELYGNLDRPTICTGYFCEIDQAWAMTGSTWLGPWCEPTHWMPLPAPPAPDTP